MAKYYGVNWTAKISGQAEIEAESEADAISKFNASPVYYANDDEERPYDFDHKVDHVEFICEHKEEE